MVREWVFLRSENVFLQLYRLYGVHELAVPPGLRFPRVNILQLVAALVGIHTFKWLRGWQSRRHKVSGFRCGGTSVVNHQQVRLVACCAASRVMPFTGIKVQGVHPDALVHDISLNSDFRTQHENLSDYRGRAMPRIRQCTIRSWLRCDARRGQCKMCTLRPSHSGSSSRGCVPLGHHVPTDLLHRRYARLILHKALRIGAQTKTSGVAITCVCSKDV